MSAGRKILYFLGAGASLGAGSIASIQGGGEISIPTQKDFWSVFLRFCSNNNRKKRIESFLFRYFTSYRKVPTRTPPNKRHKYLSSIDVEEVFTFISERVRAPSTSHQLRTYAETVWGDLVMEIGHVFRRFGANSDTRYIYKTLINNHVRTHDAIVSFNYDTVFEDSLPNNRLWAYEAVEDTKNCLTVLKPHGSINWELKNNKVTISDLPEQCVIVAPTHLKFISLKDDLVTDSSFKGYLDQTNEIQKIWASLESEMNKAKALIFIGYSFPVADLYFSSLLRSVLASRNNSPAIILVNPDAVALGERLSSRFAITDPIRYFDMEQFANTKRDDILDQI